jgi:hypothetical protein
MRAAIAIAIATVAAAAAVAGCGDNLAGPVADGAAIDAAPVDAVPRPVMRVLFIGNSYTGVNDLPGTLMRAAEAAPSGPRFEVGMWAPGGQTWEGHDVDPMVDTLIAEGWDQVVLQDQSEQPWFVTTTIKPALLALVDQVEATGAGAVLYMTWARGVSQTSDGLRFLMDMAVNHYYVRHAEVSGARIAPVGRAMQRTRRSPQVTLLDPDDSHPSPQGTYLAACVFYATLTGLDPYELGDGGLGLDAPTMALLQTAAWNTVEAQAAPAPPQVAAWPLHAGSLGDDLVVRDDVVLGGVPGPDGGTATQFAVTQHAAAPYRPGATPAQITVAVAAGLDDWSAPGGPTDEYLVARWDAFGVFRRGTELRATVTTGTTTGTTAELAYDAAGLAAGWHRVALTYDGAAAALWLDGATVATAALTGPIRYGGPDGPPTGFAIAAAPSPAPISLVAGGFPFPGPLADVRIYDRALTAGELP